MKNSLHPKHQLFQFRKNDLQTNFFSSINETRIDQKFDFEPMKVNDDCWCWEKSPAKVALQGSYIIRLIICFRRLNLEAGGNFLFHQVTGTLTVYIFIFT